jgi:hypothetical protein
MNDSTPIVICFLVVLLAIVMIVCGFASGVRLVKSSAFNNNVIDVRLTTNGTCVYATYYWKNSTNQFPFFP